jgi:tRNA threonylcarbamoyladenosine modification (KEOPS) complex Cgi121 subunit
VGLLNQLDGPNTPSCIWLRQAFAHELEKLQVRHSAIALHSLFDRERIPLEIQNHIAQASLDSNRRYLMSSARNALKSVYSKRNT